MRAVHVGLFQDFLNDVMHCKIEDDLSFRDVICFKFGASMLKFATDRRSWLVKNINTEDLSAVAVSDKIPSKVQVSARVSKTLTW